VTEIELIAVPFDGYGRPGNQAGAAAALRAAGLARVFHAHTVHEHELRLPAPERARGVQTTLINEPALIAMTEALNERVGTAVAENRFPVVYGGDCSMLLGIVTGLRDHAPDIGLVFIDGHEDTMPLDVSEDGEAANTEIGLLLGLTGRLLRGPLAARLPALHPDQLVVLAPRDEKWRSKFNVGSLADHGVWLASLADTIADPAGTGRRAVATLSANGYPRWWLHIDFDVLDPQAFPAQGLPEVADEPGGLTWGQLSTLTSAMTAAGGCVGCSFAIYDPDQDPDGTCAVDIVGFVETVLACYQRAGAGVAMDNGRS
jgi:arginase